MGILGGSLGNWGLGYDQIQQQQFANQWYQTYVTAAATSGTITINTSAYDEPPKEKGPESALEWLDRRVDEMRITL